MHSLSRTAAFVALLAAPVAGLQAASKSLRDQLAEKVAACEYSLEVVMEKPESAIPTKVLKEAKGIIVMHQYRAGVVVGGQGGSALLSCRTPQAGTWGPPVFLDPGGFSFGLQAGVKELNTVFLLMSDDAVRRAYTGRFEIGADATAVAGPKTAEVDNFDLFKAPVLVYSSSGGLFAGASMKTFWLSPSDKANRTFYNTTFTAPEIALSTWFLDKIPAEGQALLGRINGYEQGSMPSK